MRELSYNRGIYKLAWISVAGLVTIIIAANMIFNGRITFGGIITGNNNSVSESNALISGNHNTVRGDGNTVSGNNNIIYGDDNIINGNHNTVHGANNRISGNNNRFTPDAGNRASGNHNRQLEEFEETEIYE